MGAWQREELEQRAVLFRPMEMKRLATIAIASLCVCGAAAQQPAVAPKTAPATHVTKQQIQEFFAQMPPGRILDSPIRTIDVGGYKMGVFEVYRPRTHRRTRFTTIRT